MAMAMAKDEKERKDETLAEEIFKCVQTEFRSKGKNNSVTSVLVSVTGRNYTNTLDLEGDAVEHDYNISCTARKTNADVNDNRGATNKWS